MERALLLREIAALRQSRDAALDSARASHLLQKLTGIRMEDLQITAPQTLAQVTRQLKAGLERERWRGMARHRLYDLNRHIELKKVLDAVLLVSSKQNGAEAPLPVHGS